FCRFMGIRLGVRRVRVGADRRRIFGNDGWKGVSMFKRVASILFSLAFVLSLSACGGTKEDDADEEAAPKATTSTAASAPAAGAAAPAAAPAAGGATVTGKVAFTGAAPAKEQIKMDADAFCKSAHGEPVYTQE